MIEKHYITTELHRSTVILTLGMFLWVVLILTVILCLYGIAHGHTYPFAVIVALCALAGRLNWGLCRSGIQCRRRMIAALEAHTAPRRRIITIPTSILKN
jgi:hypothetical protein